MKISEKNRNKSYKEIITKETLGDMQKLVYSSLVLLGQATSQDISKHTKTAISSVVARVNELEKMGFIKQTGSKINEKTRKSNTLYSINEKQLIYSKDYGKKLTMKKIEKARKILKDIEVMQKSEIFEHEMSFIILS